MTAMLIEAYGAEGAIALSQSYSLDFLKPLVSQTAEMRKSDEDRKEDDLETRQSRFAAENKHRSIKVTTPEGVERKINLSKFATNLNTDQNPNPRNN